MKEAASLRCCRCSVAMLLVACCITFVNAKGLPRTCELGFPAGTTVLFVADPGTFSGTPESAVYLSNLRQNRQLPSGATACPSVHVGRIMRSNVAVITTGIGPMASALCIYDILDRCGPYIRDIFYSGTSGWSPQLGGVINNGTCEAGRANNNAQITRLGDICVSPYSVNWDCRQASWLSTATGFPNQCTFPQQSGGPADAAMFGQCMFPDVTKSELALADEVLAAAAVKRNSLPRRNNILQALESQYWQEMSQATRINYPPIPQSDPPRVWGYRQCMEIDSQYFWSGAPWDMVARKYVADTLNAAAKTGNAAIPASDIEDYSQTNVLAVSAMEAIGLSMAMQRYNSLSGTRRPHSIPYTYIRGMSDWVHSPLTYDSTTKIWGQGAVLENFTEGYKYAIQTASSAVLATLQVRCEMGRYLTAAAAAGGDAAAAAAGALHVGKRPRPTPNEPCTFTLD